MRGRRWTWRAEGDGLNEEWGAKGKSKGASDRELEKGDRPSEEERRGLGKRPPGEKLPGQGEAGDRREVQPGREGAGLAA
ncbi:hypothetical protein PM3016_5716 [Paenibacillus mucilaginosus 3016]|uniref:Uncharacterized protein n=1 Tax=Paenibacillus mucilaginosus 3016 TaxID=1116391 RepID=H6NKK7_9BACL|nr:hypothetical protein PM3016_5716 [Paenibacillus mucilaginosus 3016]